MDPPFPPPSSFPSFATATFTPSAGTGTPEVSAPPSEPHVVAPPSVPQPAYADMIYAAITALKERDGSSKRAITKYIEKEYAGILPEGYEESLSQHLKLLKNSGLLVMNKKSYMVPTDRSEVPNPSANGSYAAQAPVPAPATVGFLQGLQLQQTGMMFPPGIPPTLFTNPFQQQFAAGLAQAGVADGGVSGQAPAPAPFPAVADCDVSVKRGRGRPPKRKSEVPGGDVHAPQEWADAGAEVNSAQPVFVALGLADDPAKVTKRRPGRPKKVVVADEGSDATLPEAGALPQQQVMKRGRGRPPKSGAAIPGRPSKPESPIAGGTEKGPDHPPNNPDQDPQTQVNVPRPRGRPRKGVVYPGVGGIMPMKRLGRPPKAFSGLNRPKKSTGRPVGRPRKYPLLPNDAPQSGPPEGYEDMRKKLEFFQSRLMHAVGVLKSEFRNESSSQDAIKAIQELEGLASVDINAPLEDPQKPAEAAAEAEAAQQS